jgi:hypothetical protein
MLWLKGQLISLKTMSKKWLITELLEFEPLNVWSWASLPYKVPCYKIKEKELELYVIYLNLGFVFLRITSDDI